jgi:hypothetical protein
MRLRRNDDSNLSDRDGYARTNVSTVAAAETFRARGGLSAGSVMTGVVVAFGAMVLFGAVIGAALLALGTLEAEVGSTEALRASIGAGIAFVVAQFLSYMWGGYTAGRMSRGAGLLNGLFVVVVALLIGALSWAVAGALGANFNLNLPFAESRLGIESDSLIDWGVTIGIATLVAMIAGALLGGLLGARWHTKLERRTLEEREIDLRERTPSETRPTRTPPPPPPATAQERLGRRRTTSV